MLMRVEKQTAAENPSRQGFAIARRPSAADLINGLRRISAK
jgi:hypothetical protein